MDRTQRQLQHVGLPTACAVIYSSLTGTIPDPQKLTAMQASLNEVARALASVVPVYAESSVPVAIAPAELIDGVFSGGAHFFTTRSGRQLRHLTVQRGDMMAAIAIFKAAGITFAAR